MTAGLFLISSGNFCAASKAALTSPTSTHRNPVSYGLSRNLRAGSHSPAIISIPSHIVPYASNPAKITFTFVNNASSSSCAGFGSSAAPGPLGEVEKVLAWTARERRRKE